MSAPDIHPELLRLVVGCAERAEKAASYAEEAMEWALELLEWVSGTHNYEEARAQLSRLIEQRAEGTRA